MTETPADEERAPEHTPDRCQRPRPRRRDPPAAEAPRPPSRPAAAGTRRPPTPTVAAPERDRERRGAPKPARRGD